MSAFTDGLHALLIQHRGNLPDGSPEQKAADHLRYVLQNIEVKAGEAPHAHSYQYPEINVPDVLTGVDVPIESIRGDLQTLPWLRYSFGRAWEFPERQPSGRMVKVPKVYSGMGEYLNVLPNDFWPAYCFLMADGPETWDEFTKGLSNPKTRPLMAIFWFNLSTIQPGDYIGTEGLKQQAEAILKQNPYVSSIDSFVDERAEDVFKGYINPGAGSLSTADDDANPYLMYPYSGFRFSFTVKYYDNC